MTTQSDEKPPLIVLFDGTCGMCNAAVNFILARDPNRRFRFAPQQSQVAQELLTRFSLNPSDINSVVLIDNNDVYLKSNAALRIAMELPEPWPLMGVLAFIPEPLRNTGYDFIARHRKQWFKAPNACRTPTPQEREQFLS